MAKGQRKPANLYLATVQKMGVTSGRLCGHRRTGPPSWRKHPDFLPTYLPTPGLQNGAFSSISRQQGSQGLYYRGRTDRRRKNAEMLCFSKKNPAAGLEQQGKIEWRPQGDSNPCRRRERAGTPPHEVLQPQELTESVSAVAPPMAPFFLETPPRTTPGGLSSEVPGVAHETPHNPVLETLAIMLRILTPADRAALCELLEQPNE